MGNNSCFQGKTKVKRLPGNLSEKELSLIGFLYDDLALRTPTKTLDKDNFLMFFHLGGLWGQEVFALFDSNKEGEVTKDTFTRMLQYLAKGDEDSQIQILFGLFDLTRTSNISYSQLLKMFYSYPPQQLEQILNDKSFRKQLSVRQQLQLFGTQGQGKLLQPSNQYKLVSESTESQEIEARSPSLGRCYKSNHQCMGREEQGGFTYKINILIKKYIQYLFTEHGLDYKTDSIELDTFTKIVKKHPKLLITYRQGFHNYLWECSNQLFYTQTPEISDYLIYTSAVKNQDNKSEVGKNSRVFVKLVRDSLMLFTNQKEQIPIDIIFLTGLIVSRYIGKSDQGFRITHRDGFYPQKTFIVKDQRVSKWFSFLETYQAESVQDKYVKVEKIGRGNYSSVYRCHHKLTGKEYAMKQIAKKHPHIELVKSQMDVLSHLHHPNIIRLKEVFDSSAYIYIITQYLKDGDLFDYYSEGKIPMSQRNAMQVIHKVLEAVAYLNQQGLVHRDIKDQNILIEQTSGVITKVKLADFGFAAYIDTLKDKPSEQLRVGTPGFTAPQLFDLSKIYDQKIDTFSIGVLLYLLLSGDMPFNGSTNAKIFQRTMKGKYSMDKPCWASVSQNCKKFMRRLLATKPQDRPTAAEALRLDWMLEYEDKGIQISKSISSPQRSKNSNTDSNI